MATVTTIASGDWNDPLIWDTGTVPLATDRVVNDAGFTLTIPDGYHAQCKGNAPSTSNSASTSAFENRGTLTIDKAGNTEFSADGLIYNVPTSSAYQCVIDFGNETNPVTGSFKWHINPSGSNVNGYVNQVYNYYSGSRRPTFTIVSTTKRTRNTWLTGAFDAGVNVITVDDVTNWAIGDKLWLTPRYVSSSSPRDLHEGEEVEIQSISGNQITLTSNLVYNHGYPLTKDFKAGGVCNMTSNIELIGADNKPMYRIYSRRANVQVKNVAFHFANNRYNYVSSVIVIHDGNLYGLDSIVENNVFVVDSRNLSAHMRDLLYEYSSRTENDRRSNKNNAVVCKAQNGNYNFYGAFVNYYSGRNTKLENNCVYGGGTRYINVGFNCYQQPVTYTDCKVYGANYGYNLHNNVDANTKDCWAVGCNYAGYTYNGTAIHNDMHVRWMGRLVYMLSEWRGKSYWNRLDFEDEHLYQTLSKNFVNRGSVLPDGNLIQFTDLQNNTDKQFWYYSFGDKWWELVETRNDPHSIGMRSLSDTYVVPHERAFSTTTGDAVIVGVYVKNLSATFIGTLALTIKQGSEVIQTQDFDLTALTADEWNLISISGTATKTMDTTYLLEYKGNGGEIAITDFVEPFTANEVSQAAAVWAAKSVDNSFSGTMGEVQNNVDNNVDSVLLDTNELQTNQNNWITATGFATENPPSQNLDDYKSTGFAVPGEYDTELAAIQSDLDDPAQYKADITGLSTFDAANDAVARVTLVDTTTANTDMRGTDDALLAASYTTPSTPAQIYNEFVAGSNEDAFKADTSALATQADITSLNDLSSADVTAAVPSTAQIEAALLNEGDGQQLIDAIVVAIGNTNLSEASLVAAIRADLERVGGTLKLVEADLNDPDQYKADVSNLSADVNVVEVNGVAVTNIDQFKADVSGLSTFDPGTDTVANVALVDTTSSGGGLTQEESDTLSLLLDLAESDEEKNVLLNKYYKRHKTTKAILVEKDYNKDGDNNEKLTE